MYQVRVTSTPRSVSLIRSSVLAVPPSMIRLGGNGVALTCPSSAPSSGSRRGSSRRPPAIQSVALVGRPSPFHGDGGDVGWVGSDQTCTRSSTSFSPSLVPPPALDRKLRPSSAWRASRLKIRCCEQVDRPRFGLQDHGVLAGLDRLGVAAGGGLFERDPRRRAGVEPGARRWPRGSRSPSRCRRWSAR